jgi:hypothetical protein
MALFTAGQVLTAAELNALGLHATKTADQSVTSSTTLINDIHLSIAIPTVGTYLVDTYLYGVSAANAAGDLQLGYSFPAGTMSGFALGPDASLASGTVQAGQWGVQTSITGGVAAFINGLSTSTVAIWAHTLLTVTATGTLQLMWAQNSSSASASTLKAGSHMLVRQVA